MAGFVFFACFLNRGFSLNRKIIPFLTKAIKYPNQLIVITIIIKFNFCVNPRPSNEKPNRRPKNIIGR